LLADTIESGTPRLLSAASLLEASMVIETRKGEAGGRELDLFIYRAGIEVVPVDQEQAEVARIAWRQYEGPAPGQPELRRLLLLCTGEGPRRVSCVQGRWFHSNGSWFGKKLTENEKAGVSNIFRDSSHPPTASAAPALQVDPPEDTSL
jgi:hypothetical protein